MDVRLRDSDVRKRTGRSQQSDSESGLHRHRQLNSCENRMGVQMSKKKLNVGMFGSGFIGKVHSNAFRQVGHFFDIPYEVCCKVICARDRKKLETVLSPRIVKTTVVAGDIFAKLYIEAWLRAWSPVETLPAGQRVHAGG